MKSLNEVLLSEIEKLRVKGNEFYNGEITVNEFKHLSGGMGVYAERGGKSFMVRLRIPSGVISVEMMKDIYYLAERYNTKKLHFTTRQAIQYHGLSIDDVCDFMIEALRKGIYTRGAGGNFPRNIALSPLSGIDKEEMFDPTEYALATGDYFMERILTYKLPRKLKVSFSNSEKDTAHCTVQDLGFLAVNKGEENYFKVYLGGGLGRDPKLAAIYPELIKPEEVLYYVEGMVNLFIAEGNYENRSKARVRYILDRLGEEEFIKLYKKHVNEAKKNKELNINININTSKVNKIGIEANITNQRLYKQKQEGLYSIYVHPIGGQIKSEDFKAIVKTIENYKDIEMRLSMTEGVYIRNLNGIEVEKVLDITKDIGGESEFEHSIACIGVPTCQIGIANSQEALSEAISYLKDKSDNLELLPRIYISGCQNSCGVHEVGAIGFTGKKKRVNDIIKEVYELHINGSFNVNEARLGEIFGDIAREDIPKFIFELNEFLQKENKKFNVAMRENRGCIEALAEKYLC